MADWRDRGYVADSDDDDDRAETLDPNIHDGQSGHIKNASQNVGSHGGVIPESKGDTDVLKEAQGLLPKDEIPTAETQRQDQSSGHNQGNGRDSTGSGDTVLSRLINSPRGLQDKPPSATPRKDSEKKAESISLDLSSNRDTQTGSNPYHGPDPTGHDVLGTLEDAAGLLDSSSPLSSILSDLPSSLSSPGDHSNLRESPTNTLQQVNIGSNFEENSSAALTSSMEDLSRTELNSNDQRRNDRETTQAFIDPFGHSLRKRKPIQLHPYMLESERYRQSLKDRGLKPLRLAQAEQEARRQIESQNGSQEFQDTLGVEDEGVHAYDVIQSSQIQSPQSSVLNPEDEDLPDLENLFQQESQARNGAAPQQHNIPRTNLGHLRPSSLQRNDNHELNPVQLIGQSHRSPPPYATPDHSSSIASRKASVSKDPRNIHSPKIGHNRVYYHLDAVVSESSEEEINLPRKRLKLGRQIPCSPSTSELTSDASNSSRIHHVQKKIKGVLPASWLRLDQQTRQNPLPRSRPAQGPKSPMKHTHQPGIARRLGRISSGGNISASRMKFFELSDDSDSSEPNATRLSPEQSTLCLKAVQDKPPVPDVDSESDDMMEQDVIEPMLAANVRKYNHDKPKQKRKNQITLEDMTSGPRPRTSSSVLAQRKISQDRQQRTRYKPIVFKPYSKGSNSRRTRAPALSVLDYGTPSTLVEVPKFIKIAKRQARSRKDRGQHTPTQKFIKLGNRQDTEDVQSILYDWREGTIRPVSDVSPKNRLRVLLEHSKNIQCQQQLGNQQVPDAFSDLNLDQDFNEARRTSVNQSLNIEQHSHSDKENRGSDTNLRPQIEPQQDPKQPPLRQPQKPPRKEMVQKPQEDSRPAQLESLESEAFRQRPKARFRHQLSYLDRLHSRRGAAMFGRDNLLLQRFLIDEDVSAHSIEETSRQDPILSTTVDSSAGKPQPKAVPIPRKRQPMRIDADTVEYRQDQDDFTRPTTIQDDVADVEFIDTLLPVLGTSAVSLTADFGIKPLHPGAFFHESTILGSGELAKVFEAAQSRNYDIQDGNVIFTHDSQVFRWSVWNESVSSELICLFRSTCQSISSTDQTNGIDSRTFQRAMLVTRFFIRYFSQGLSFSDSVDRLSFIRWSHQFLAEMGAVLSDFSIPSVPLDTPVSNLDQLIAFHSLSRLVFAFQFLEIARKGSLSNIQKSKSEDYVLSAAKSLFQIYFHLNLGRLRPLYEGLRSYHQREAGIKDEGWLLEGWVVAMLVLRQAGIGNASYERLFNSFMLQGVDSQTSTIQVLENTWQTIFTVLPLQEFDQHGFIKREPRYQSSAENWAAVKPMVSRVLSWYSSGSKIPPGLNQYCRAILSRCHVLIKQWAWQSSEVIIGLLFDFFANRRLAHLPHEEIHTSVRYLQNLNEEQSLDLEPGDAAFHIFLKVIACGFQSMRKVLSDRKIRNIAFRLMPNHGRQYPKDRSVRQEDLDALRNHHDLLSTLFWASPSPARPSIKSIRDLVDIENSHREACQINLRAWTNLARFMVTSEESVKDLTPFRDWHDALTTRTIRQRVGAKDEAYAQAAELSRLEGTNVSSTLLQSVIGKNERQVETMLSDILLSLKQVLKLAKSLEIMVSFLSKESISEVLDLHDGKRQSLNKTIMIALEIINLFLDRYQVQSRVTAMQQIGEDSQEYGDWTDIEDVEVDSPRSQAIRCYSETIYEPLFRLLSNAFGAEEPPGDELLQALTDTWILSAHCLVQAGRKSWENFLGHYQPGSWQSLRRTEQTRKYTCYFLAKVIEKDRMGYELNKSIILSLWISSLVERESLLKHQNLLTSALLNNDSTNSLLSNLPFWKLGDAPQYVIDVKTFSDRRLSLISSILSNMRRNLQESSQYSPHDVPKVRQEYVELIRALSASMKANYAELGQGSNATGAYVSFVQRVIELLQQHTIEFCPVDKFFTNPAAFPLPVHDPNYVVGRLKNYGLKISEPRMHKQLIVFLNSIFETAAAESTIEDDKFDQLARQLYDATSEDLEMDGAETLSTFLARDIFSTYIEVAMSTECGWIMAQPILRAVQLMSEHLIEHLNVTNPTNVASALSIINPLLASLLGVFKKVTECWIPPSDTGFVRTTLQIFEIVTELLSPLDYIHRRTGKAAHTVKYINLLENLAKYLLSEVDYGGSLENLDQSLYSSTSDATDFCRKTLVDSLRQRWTFDGVRYFVCRGSMRREIVVEHVPTEVRVLDLKATIKEFERVRQRMVSFGRKGRSLGRSIGGDLLLPEIW
jgi:hypothetical protein